MKHKRIQLWLHQRYKAIQVGIIVAAILAVAIGFAVLIATQNRLLGQVQGLSEQNKDLIVQTKHTGEQNQSIAKQNRSYTRCIATVFAQYTHDFNPVTITNLDTCTIDSQTKTTNNTSTGGTAPQTSPQPTAAPDNTNAQPPKSTAPPAQQPSQPVNVLGIPLCLPLVSNVCVDH